MRKERIWRDKVYFLGLELLVLFAVWGLVFFAKIIIFGIPEMSPYPANPFFLFSFFLFFTCYGLGKLKKIRKQIGISTLELIWFFLGIFSSILLIVYYFGHR